MDASDDSTNHGNGNGSLKPDHPETASLPSAALPPAGGPVVPSAQEVKAGPPIPRDDKGRFPKGVSGNPRGNFKRTPTLNSQLLKVLKTFKLKDANGTERAALEVLILRAFQEPEVLKKLLDKIFADATPPAPAATINNNNAPIAGASSSSESHVDLAKLLADPTGREGIAQFAERLAACGAQPGESRNVRN